MRRSMLCAAVALTGWGCGTDFAPTTLVNQLRVLAVRANPPELNPGQVAALDALVVNPSQPDQATTLLFLGCDPDPAGLATNPCAEYSNLQEATNLFADAGFSSDGGFDLELPGARFLGVNQAEYGVPAGFFDSVPAGSVAPQAGVLAVILMLAIAEPLPNPLTPDAIQNLIHDVASGQTPSVLTIKRIRLSLDTTLDVNPHLEGVFTGTDVLEPGHALRLQPGARAPLIAAETPKPSPTYVSIGPDGSQETVTEVDEVSWFSTAGKFDDERTELQQVPPVSQGFTAPSGKSSDPTAVIPQPRSFDLWAVLRDGRGGVDWAELPGFVCDDSLPTPTISSVSVSSGPSLLIAGSNLDQVLDQTLGGLPLLASFSAGDIVGRLPPSGSGTAPLDLRAKSCQDVVQTASW